ncbi:HET-domain-containing protein, partial [Ophiobolus disseminans]
MYHPLQTATTIRLLDIDPGDSTDVVTCRLRHCDLATNPDFEALSYVWGKPVFAARILCNSQVVHITPSLYQALKRVRLATTLRTVWADALCINQQDAAERSRQVQLMQHIYRDARRVLVWLGPD